MPDENELVTRAILKEELGAFEDKMDTKLTALKDRMVEQMRSIETTLLTEFRKWALPINSRLTALETHHERLALIEERLRELEKAKS